MEECIIFKEPILLILFGVALALCIYDKKYHASKGWFTIIESVLVVGTLAYAILLGAVWSEIIIVLLLFLSLNLEGWK